MDYQSAKEEEEVKELMHGKVKTLYDTDGPQKVLIKYEDKVTAFDGKMVDYPESKGATCCLISVSYTHLRAHET